MGSSSDDSLIFLRPFFLAELGVARSVKALSAGPHPLPDVNIDAAIKWAEGKMGIGFADSQRAAIRAAVTNKLMVVTGGPAVDDGAVMLAVCGGYQLLGHSYQLGEERLPGIGLAEITTVREPGPRLIGNVVIEADLGGGPRTIAGFENHGGRTYLGPQATPLGKVLAGHGNNSEDHAEGCVYRNVFGTYLHGSLLPKNPHFADYILGLALGRKYGDHGAEVMRAPLDDAMEWRAHEHMWPIFNVGDVGPDRHLDG